MSDFDVSIEAQIDALHAEAEELRDRAKHPAQTETGAEILRRAATRKVKQAARLRAQAGADA